MKQKRPYRKPEQRNRPVPVSRTAPRNRTEPGIRLNKMIADSGYSSRREADRLIAEGRVRINGRVVTELGVRVSYSDKVEVNGKQIADPPRKVYLLLNKPKGVITTVSDDRGRKTVMDLIDTRQRVYPIGRLDRNTTGVLLLTNDGELANRLMHPRYGVERFYEAVLDKPIELRDAKKISEGVDIGDGEYTQPCEIFVDHNDHSIVSIEIREGKNREVRRMFEGLGYEVIKLNRRMYAGLTARGLRRGESRPLERAEIEHLRKIVKISW